MKLIFLMKEEEIAIGKPSDDQNLDATMGHPV